MTSLIASGGFLILLVVEITLASDNKRARRVTHKHIVELPTSVDQAKKLDNNNGNTPWIDAIKR